MSKVIFVIIFLLIMVLLFDLLFEGWLYKTMDRILTAHDVAPNKMAFKSFVAFYMLNPDKWELLDGYVKYKTVDKDLIDICKERVELKYINPRYSPAPTKIYKFSFSHKDFWKYQHFRKHIFEMQKIEEQRKEEKHNYEQYQEALEYLKKDLEDFKKQKPWEDIK